MTSTSSFNPSTWNDCNTVQDAIFALCDHAPDFHFSTPKEQSALEHHIAECPTCSRYQQEMQATLHALQSLKKADLETPFLDEVQQEELISAIIDKTQTTQTTINSPQPVAAGNVKAFAIPHKQLALGSLVAAVSLFVFAWPHWQTAQTPSANGSSQFSLLGASSLSTQSSNRGVEIASLDIDTLGDMSVDSESLYHDPIDDLVGF